MVQEFTESLENSPAGPTAEQVLEYLAGHPDFLATHPDLLARLIPPTEHKQSRATGIVDFQHFMVRRLQGELAREADERREMITYARTNLNLLTRIHACVLALLEAQSFEQMIAAITGDLAVAGTPILVRLEQVFAELDDLLAGRL